MPIVGDLKNVLSGLNKEVEAKENADWIKKTKEWKAEYPLGYRKVAEDKLVA